MDTEKTHLGTNGFRILVLQAEPGRWQQENFSLAYGIDNHLPAHALQSKQPMSEGHVQGVKRDSGNTMDLPVWWRELENKTSLLIHSILHQWSTECCSWLWAARGRSQPYPTVDVGLPQHDHKYIKRKNAKWICIQSKLRPRCLFKGKKCHWVILQVISLILLNSIKSGGYQQAWNSHCSLGARMNFRIAPESWNHTMSLFSHWRPNLHGSAPAVMRTT